MCINCPDDQSCDASSNCRVSEESPFSCIADCGILCDASFCNNTFLCDQDPNCAFLRNNCTVSSILEARRDFKKKLMTDDNINEKWRNEQDLNEELMHDEITNEKQQDQQQINKDNFEEMELIHIQFSDRIVNNVTIMFASSLFCNFLFFIFRKHKMHCCSLLLFWIVLLFFFCIAFFMTL